MVEIRVRMKYENNTMAQTPKLDIDSHANNPGWKEFGAACSGTSLMAFCPPEARPRESWSSLDRCDQHGAAELALAMAETAVAGVSAAAAQEEDRSPPPPQPSHC